MNPKDTNVKGSRPVKARRDEKGEAQGTQEWIWVVRREGLARVLDVSVRTVDRMLAMGKITPLDLPSGLVRFHVPGVIAELSQQNEKIGRMADGEKLKAETLKAEIRTQALGARLCFPSGEIRVPKSEIRTVNGAQKSKWRTEV
jgi:hypothetical protein